MESSVTSRKSRIQILTIFFLLFVALSCSLYSYPAQQQAEPAAASQMENSQEKVHPAPQNIKEKIGIYVFLGWVWLSILVLIYFLKLKIQEADRLYELDFYSDPKNKSST